jgi:hypothetical protein
MEIISYPHNLYCFKWLRLGILDFGTWTRLSNLDFLRLTANCQQLIANR